VLIPPPPPPEHDRILLVGDIVGKPGTQFVCQAAMWLKKQLNLAALIVNAENSADGSGLTLKDYQRLVSAGVDVITMGDHIYRKREIMEVLDSKPNIVRPANFPPTASGKKWCVMELNQGPRLYVVSLIGRVFMKPVDCPFHAAEKVLEEIRQHEASLVAPTITMTTDVSLPYYVIIDFHAEATSDKQLMGRMLDGRVTGVLGTHTHVTTADDQILPRGTGFQCDVGMTGAFESILGRKIDSVLEATLTLNPVSFSVATQDVRLSGTWIDACRKTGLCSAIGRVVLRENELGTS
jgi:2',3'-cyclic-nucleotide 2'-phosphodiesterase